MGWHPGLVYPLERTGVGVQIQAEAIPGSKKSFVRAQEPGAFEKQATLSRTPSHQPAWRGLAVIAIPREGGATLLGPLCVSSASGVGS